MRAQDVLPQNVLPARFARQLCTARQLAEERRRRPEEQQMATACPALDRLLAGGIERGTMVELIGGRSSGRFSLVLTALAAATASGEAAALVDLGDGFEPRSAAAAGVDLERLLWARPRRLKEVMASAEAILQSGIPLLVLDLGMPPVPGGRGAEASWLRLARSARAHRVALLVASPYRVSGTAAQTVLEARAPRGRWHGGDGYGGAGYGGDRSPRLLRGVAARLEMIKSRDFRRREGDAEPLRLRLAADLASEPWGGGGVPGERAELRRAVA